MSYPIVESSATALSVDNLSVSLVIVKPTGTVAGNLLVAFIASDGAITITEPGDWTEIVQGSTDTYCSGGAFYRIAGASEPADYTFGVSAAEGIAGGIVRISGAHATTPINVSAWTETPAASTSSDAPSVTTTVNECLILRFAYIDAGYTVGGSPATVLWEIEKGSVGGVGNLTAWGNAAVAGSTGTATFTHRSEQTGHITVAIAPVVLNEIQARGAVRPQPPSVHVQQRDLSEFIALPGLKLRPLRWSWREPGGCGYAEIEADAGSVDSQWAALQLIRCPLTIRNGNGTPVWWGYVAEVSFTAGAVGFSVNIDSMSNRVAVAYSFVEAGSQTVGERRTTGWAEDTISIAEWGQKELLASVDGATSTRAEAVRDTILGLTKYPQALSGPAEQSGPGFDRLNPSRIVARGWWNTLGWRYYANSNTASVQTTAQITAIESAVGEFFTGTDIVTASGVYGSEYRDGDSTALAEVEALLSGLSATVTVERLLRINTQAASGDDDWLLLADGRFSTRLNAVLEPGAAILGWTQLRGVVPASANLSYMAAPSPFYIEENEYDASAGTYRWRARGMPSPWELTRLEEG